MSTLRCRWPCLEQGGCKVSVRPVLNAFSTDTILDSLYEADLFFLPSVSVLLHVVHADFQKKTRLTGGVLNQAAVRIRQGVFAGLQADIIVKTLLDINLK